MEAEKIVNMAMGLKGWGDLSMHDCMMGGKGMQGRRQKQGYDEDLLCMLLSALCDLYD